MILTATAALVVSCDESPEKTPPPPMPIIMAAGDTIAEPDTVITFAGRRIWLDWRSKITIISDQDFKPGLYHAYAVTFDTSAAGICTNIADNPFMFGDCRVVYPLSSDPAYIWPREFTTILELKYMTGAEFPTGDYGLWIRKTDGRP